MYYVKKDWWLVGFTVFSAAFNNISVIAVSFIGGGKTTDLSQVTDQLYHIILYTSPWSIFELTTSVVIGTDCIGSCKSNYHSIITRTAPLKTEMRLKVVTLNLLRNINVKLWISIRILTILNGTIYWCDDQWIEYLLQNPLFILTFWKLKVEAI